MSRPTKLFNAKYIIFIVLQTLNFALLYFTFPVIPKYAIAKKVHFFIPYLSFSVFIACKGTSLF